MHASPASEDAQAKPTKQHHPVLPPISIVLAAAESAISMSAYHYHNLPTSPSPYVQRYWSMPQAPHLSPFQATSTPAPAPRRASTPAALDQDAVGSKAIRYSVYRGPITSSPREESNSSEFTSSSSVEDPVRVVLFFLIMRLLSHDRNFSPHIFLKALLTASAGRT